LPTLKDVLHNAKWDVIRSILTEWYITSSDSFDTFEQVFECLLSLDPAKYKEDVEIVIEPCRVITCNGMEPYVEIELYGMYNGEKYMLEFCDWSDWLGFSVNKENLECMSAEKIVAACLVIMTTHGNTPAEVLAARETTERNLEEAVDMLIHTSLLKLNSITPDGDCEEDLEDDFDDYDDEEDDLPPWFR